LVIESVLISPVFMRCGCGALRASTYQLSPPLLGQEWLLRLVAGHITGLNSQPYSSCCCVDVLYVYVTVLSPSRFTRRGITALLAVGEGKGSLVRSTRWLLNLSDLLL
jgi:hypothetical protein